MFTKPIRFALNVALDMFFGKEESFEFTGSTTTPDFFYDSNPKTTVS